MALVLCFHFQLGVLRGLNMSVVSERMSFQSCSVSPSCNSLFIVYPATDMRCVFTCTLWRFPRIYVHLNCCFFSCELFMNYNSRLTAMHFWIYLIEKGLTKMHLWALFVFVCVFELMLMTLFFSVPGQHRSLGPSISKVRSLKLDSSTWSNVLVEVCIMFSLWVGTT